MIFLNRLDIVGGIDHNTPLVVLIEICKASSIKIDEVSKMIKKIYRYKGVFITRNFENNMEDLRLIASYVNIDHPQWKRAPLLKAYNFLSSFSDINYCKNFRFNKIRNIGPQTLFSPKSLNACVLYKLCKVNNLFIDLHTTIEEMNDKLKLFYQISSNFRMLTDIKTTIFNSLKFDMDNSKLVNILSMIHYPLVNNIEQEEQEKEQYNEFYSIPNYNLLSVTTDDILSEDRREPRNHIEAVIMAALYYKLDISNCSNPKIEYELLKITPYFPHDENLKNRLKLSSIHEDFLLNPYLNRCFNPNFPMNMYNTEDLINLCVNEGINIQDEYYTFLQMAYLTESFVHGKQGNIINTTNTFLQNINNLDYNEVVVYGIRNENQMRVFTYGELKDTFSSYKRFTNPATNETFSEEGINKLYSLTKKDKFPNESDEQYLERKELGDVIDRIKLYISSTNSYLYRFVNTYEQSENKKKIESALTTLLHLAMYMRNWSGIGDFPLTSEQTNYDLEKQIEIDHRVTQCLLNFENKCEDIDIDILNLPLMQYRAGEFITVNDESEGLTIKDRIRIIRCGENQSGIASCIRLSSNKFIATSYYYMIVIGMRLPFNISEVSHIF